MKRGVKIFELLNSNILVKTKVFAKLVRLIIRSLGRFFHTQNKIVKNLMTLSL